MSERISFDELKEAIDHYKNTNFFRKHGIDDGDQTIKEILQVMPLRGSLRRCVVWSEDKTQVEPAYFHQIAIADAGEITRAAFAIVETVEGNLCGVAIGRIQFIEDPFV